MRKGTLAELTFSSSNEPTERHSVYRQNTSLQADLERIENPFRNLHAKIYYRQRKASSKMIKDKTKEVLKTDLKSSPPVTNMNNDQQTKLPNSSSLNRIEDYSVTDEKTTRTNSQNAVKKDQLKVDGSFNSNTYLNGCDKTTYLNQRNMSEFKDSLSEKDKVIFPLIVTPRSLSREYKEPFNTHFVPSRESQQEFLPRLRYASFHSLVYEDEKKKKRKWEKSVRDSQETRCVPQEHEPFARPPCTTAKDHRYETENKNFIPQQNLVSVSRRYRPILRSDTKTIEHDCKVDIEVNASKNGEYNSRNHVYSPKTLSECNYISKDVNSNFMTLKAKLHRSAFI